MARDLANQGASSAGGLEPGTLSVLLRQLAATPEKPGELTAPPLVAGQAIGRFELVREIGRGGFGVVWQARDRELGRLVAFKLVRPGRMEDLREERLQREAEAAARLSHDNIVALHDVGRSEQGPYLVLELLEGKTLAERLEAGALPLAEGLRIFREVTTGVAHAHGKGVIHRDLKPANVFTCDDGRVKVLDFGLAHAFGQRRQSGGTPAYMAPEQWREAPEDERTDVFALGVLLYQLITGLLPFEGEKEAVGSRPAPSLEVPGAPALGPLVARLLEKDPVRRPRDAGEVLSRLEQATAGADLFGAAPAQVRARRHPRWRLAGLVAASAVIGVAAYVVYSRLHDRLAKADEKISVAVADVVNETGEKELDVLSGLLVTSLEQSRRLAVMTQARVLDLAAKQGRTGATRVDEAIGREVGRANGVQALLLPAVRRLGSTYSVEMRAIDPVKDKHLFTVSERATSKDGMMGLLDRLSGQARRELHEEPAELERSSVQLGTAMTRSLEAYQHYQAGLEARNREGLRAVALREQLAALALDPQFGPAHHEIASIYRDAYGRPDLAEPYLKTARDLADRMPEKERLIHRLDRAISAMSGSAGEDPRATSPEEVLALAEELEARFPGDKFALAEAASAYLYVDKDDKAEEGMRKVLQLDPGYFRSAGELQAHLRSRTAEGLEVARRAVATRRSASNLNVLASALLATGADAEALAAAREALVAGALETRTVERACSHLAQRSPADECGPALKRLMAEGLNEHERDKARTAYASLLAIQGRMREARRLLLSVEEARRGNPFSLMLLFDVGHRRLESFEASGMVRRLDSQLLRRWWSAFFGDMAEANRITGALAGTYIHPVAEMGFRPFVLAQEGRFSEAVDASRVSLDDVERDANPGNITLSSYLYAEALLAAGRLEETATFSQKILPCRCVAPLLHAANYPRLALVRARAMEQLGRRADAIHELDGVISFWKQADDDLPLLVEVKAMRRRLGGR